MSKPEEFKLLKIQTVVLKVHIHCDGCRQEVKKLLQKIEGVYTVSIDAEHQKVTVSGNVDSSTLIKKLARSGKHAEVWSQKLYSSNSSSSNNQIKKFSQQQHQQHQGKDVSKNKINDKNNQAFIQGLKAFKNQHNTIESLSSDDEDFDDDDYEDEDDFDEADDDDEQLGILADKLKQLNLLNKQPCNPAAAAAANSKKTCSNDGGGKRRGGNNPPIQAPIGMKPINGLQPKGFPMAPNHKVIHNGAPLVKGTVEGKMGNGLMNLSSLQGLNGTNGFGSHQAQHQQHPQLAANFPTGYPTTTGGNGGGFGMMNMRGINSGGSSGNNDNNMMLMNESRYMQPQVMCNRSPQIPPYTGYCYPYPYYRSPYVSHYPETGGYGDHLFSDENTSSCAVM